MTKLNVGDKVKVVAGYDALFNGRIGIVTDVEGNDVYVASKSNLPTDYHQGDDFHLYFWGSEVEPVRDTPTIGTLAEIGAQVGDVVEWQSGRKPKYAISLIAGGKYYEGDDMEDDLVADEPNWRIISRASDAKSPVELSVDLDEAIKQVVAESQSGPVQLRKVIVPGRHGPIKIVKADDGCDIYVDALHTDDKNTIDVVVAHLTAIRDAM